MLLKGTHWMSWYLTQSFSHFSFHTGEFLSITLGAHGRGASTESRHSVEEQSTPAVKRKRTHDEDIATQG